LRTSLSNALKQATLPIYHILGAETLLVEEAVDQLRSHLISMGYAERLRFTSEPGFDWGVLLRQNQIVSLFSEKKIIELRIPTGNPGVAGTKALLSYADKVQTTDTVMIVVSGPIEQRAQNYKWFKKLNAIGMVVEYPAVSVQQLPMWINQRMMQLGIQFDSAVARRLAHYVEGNLLAAAQTINLLSLQYPNQNITVEMIEQVIADNARFNIFHFVDACLSGCAQRSIRILQSLKKEQVEPAVFLWALSKDIRILYCLLFKEGQGIHPQSLFQKYGIWSRRSCFMQSALRRISISHCLSLIQKLGQIDLMIKGRVPLQKQDIWEEIEGIILRFCVS